MKNLRSLILLLLAATIISACGGDAGYERLETGVAIKFVETLGGKKSVQGDIMEVDMTTTLADSVIFQSNLENHLPLNAKQGPAFWIDVLDRCSEGDSVALKMPLKLYAQVSGFPIADPKDTSVEVNLSMRVRKIESMTMYIENKKAEQLQIDLGIIENYLAENSIEAEQVEGGVHIALQEEGTGGKPTDGQEVFVNYTVRLLDGTFIDSSNEELNKENGTYNPQRTYGPLSFALGRPGIIPGWNIAFKHLNKGAKAKLLIPSGEAYGPQPRGNMPGNSVLIFDVELVDFK